jgi:hypothetical protein
MTAVPKDPQISELRELFRHLLEFRSVYEATGLEEIVTPYGNTWSLWDLEYLFHESKKFLTSRESQAIALCLVHNRREKDAAEDMGVSPTNPVMMYATRGLRRILDLIDSGELHLYRWDAVAPRVHAKYQRERALHLLADQIKSIVKIVRHDCWAFPDVDAAQAPMIRIPSLHYSSGFAYVHPQRVLYEAYVQRIPTRIRIVHKQERLPSKTVPRFRVFHPACINPEHGLLAQ